MVDKRPFILYGMTVDMVHAQCMLANASGRRCGKAKVLGAFLCCKQSIADTEHLDAISFLARGFEIPRH